MNEYVYQRVRRLYSALGHKPFPSVHTDAKMSRLDFPECRLRRPPALSFQANETKSEWLKNNTNRKIGFKEVQEIWQHPYYEDQRSDEPEQFRVIGWAKGKLYSVIYEIREDEEGEYCHLDTLWKSTKEEQKLYEENS